MKKKWIGFSILFLLAVLVLFSAEALAAGHVSIGAGRLDDGYYYINGANGEIGQCVSSVDNDQWNAHYYLDEDNTPTLELKGMNLTKSNGNCINTSTISGLNIILIGENIIVEQVIDEFSINEDVVILGENTTVTGSGSLSASINVIMFYEEVVGIRAAGNLSVGAGVSIMAFSKTNSGLVVNNNLIFTRSGASVTGQSIDDHGMKINGSIIFNAPGTLKAISDLSTAFSSDPQLNLSGFLSYKIKADDTLVSPDDYSYERIKNCSNFSIEPGPLYTVSYNANGGNGDAMANGTAGVMPFMLPECTFTPPEGMMFREWAIGTANSATRVAAGDCHTFTEDSTVYAIWAVPIKASLKLKKNGLVFAGLSSIWLKNKNGRMYELTESTPGQYTANVPNGTYTIYTNHINTNSAYTVTVNNADVSQALSCYTVSFNTNGGTPVPVRQIVAQGGYAKAPYNSVSRANDVFDGWYADEALTEPWTLVTSPVNAAVTLYAKWTIKPPEQLAHPVDLMWNGGGIPAKAMWSAIENSVGYSVQLYNGSEKCGTAVSTIETEYDFSAVINETGNYTFKVIAVGNGTQYINSYESNYSNDYNYAAPSQQREMPAYTSWDTQTRGKATWASVSNQMRYAVQLWKDNEIVGYPQYTTNTFYDFSSVIKKTGNYYFTVQTIGDGIAWKNSDVKKSEGYDYKASIDWLGMVTNAYWDVNVPAKATWYGVENAIAYSVQLYKGGDRQGDPVLVSSHTFAYDFTSVITETGNYSFNVKALGDGVVYSNGPSSMFSDIYYHVALSSITASFAQGETMIYPFTALVSLKPMLTVSGTREDGTQIENITDYELSGALTEGESTITVSCQGKTATFQVNVTGLPKLAAPTDPAWDTDIPAKAKWTAVTNAESYSVQLYKDDVAQGAAVSAVDLEYDFTSVITEAGNYSFTVTAVGDKIDYDDSPASAASPEYTIIQLTVSGTTVANKPHDGNLAAAVTLGTVTGIADGDDVTVTPTGTFDTSEEGENKTITVTYALSGADAYLYLAPVSEQLSANITSPGVAINTTTFPDEGFRMWCLNQEWGTDGVLTDLEVMTITTINFGGMYHTTDNIRDLTGIEHFVELTNLDCSNMNQNSLDVSKNTKLTVLNCADNLLGSLDVTKNTELTDLNCANNSIVLLDVTMNTRLTDLDCSNNYSLGLLDVTKNTELTDLNCANNSIVSLDVTMNTRLTDLDCSNNPIVWLDVTKNTELTVLNCIYDLLVSLDVTKNTKLINLDCSYNSLGSLNVTQNTELTVLKCVSDGLFLLDVSKNTKLTYLDCGLNYITSLDTNYNVNLIVLICLGNTIDKLNITQCTQLETLNCGSNQLTNLSISQNTKLKLLMCSENLLTTLDISENAALREIFCMRNRISDATALKALSNERGIALTFEPQRISLIVSGTTIDSKTYDGNSEATVNLGTVSGIIDGKDVTVIASGTFDTSEIGESKTVTITYTLEGWYKNYYTAPASERVTASITAKPLIVTGTTAASKPYDGNVAATVSLGTVSGKVSGDDVAVTASGVFDTSEIGANKNVTVTYALTGADAGNYTAPASETVKASIIGTVATPVANPAAGTYIGERFITLTCSVQGATIRYTTDGREPTEDDAVYSESFSVNATTTIKAKAFKAGWTSSETMTATYTITPIQLESIHAVFTQGTNVVYTNDKLDDLRSMITVTGTNNDGSAVAGITDYTLSGILTAGQSTITVSFEGKTTTFTAHVTAFIAAIIFDHEQLLLTPNDVQALHAEVHLHGFAASNLSWISANTSIATVDGNGVITAVKPGVVTITATIAEKPDAIATCRVTVDVLTTVQLPNALTTIEAEAFAALPVERFVASIRLTDIGAKAFKDCAQLLLIELPSSVIHIAPDAFEGCSNVIIVCPAGSDAEEFAKNHDMICYIR